MQVNPSQPYPAASERQAFTKPAGHADLKANKTEQNKAPQIPSIQEKTTPVSAQGSGLERLSLGLDSTSAESHVTDLQAYVKRSGERQLSLKEKDEVISIFEASALDGSLHDLVERLDNSGQLEILHKKLGTLVNESGGASAVLGILTLGMSWGAEAHDNRAFNLEHIFEKHQVKPEILKRLKNN